MAIAADTPATRKRLVVADAARTGAGRDLGPLETAYDHHLQTLIGVALGPLAEDPQAPAVVATLIGPAAFYGLQQRGLSAEEATTVGLELAIPWLEGRRRARTDRRGRRG